VGALKSALREGRTVSSATYEAGFNSGRRVYETASDALGMTPGTYRRRGTGVTIHYAAVPTTLGLLLVAVTERGVCSVSLGDDEAALVEALRAEFPAAELARASDTRDRLVDAVVAHVEGRAEGEELPIDVRATAFQWQVWRALQRIPEGATRSYQAIAEELGRPTAARAVARACASNRVAVLIPCHRVVRGDGALGGYRWGIARKAALLAREGARPAV
jgi:AraC family transcriptional regulator, regulatory protein of adaptative response / methylated-DNA-[protein]-cysteine methyltransferase